MEKHNVIRIPVKTFNEIVKVVNNTPLTKIVIIETQDDNVHYTLLDDSICPLRMSLTPINKDYKDYLK